MSWAGQKEEGKHNKGSDIEARQHIGYNRRRPTNHTQTANCCNFFVWQILRGELANGGLHLKCSEKLGKKHLSGPLWG